MCARWSPVLLSGDGHTSVRGRRETPRDEADLCWQLLFLLYYLVSTSTTFSTTRASHERSRSALLTPAAYARQCVVSLI